MEFFEDFDDFENDGFMDEDSFEDNLEEDREMDIPSAEDPEPDSERNEAESKADEFTAKDAVIIGGAMGFAYEEGLSERNRRKRKRFSDDLE